MKIEMKAQIAGSRNGVRWPAAGGVVDLPTGEALDLIKAGLAEPVAEVAEPEKATAKRAEKRG